VTPITYFPISVDYTATAMNLTGKGSATDFSAGVTFGLRGLGSGPSEFNLNRYNADGNFIVFRGDLSHTQELPMGMQLFGKIQGQLANQALVSSEEFSGGGQSTVRGYLEAEAVGDNGAFATLELRSPSLFGFWEKKNEQKKPSDKPVEKSVETEKIGEWRFYVFGDAGGLTLIDSLSGQQARYTLTSVGVGTSIFLLDHFSGSLDAGYPLNSQAHTKAHDLHLTFRASLNY
jgi:hemolysin activation/secretion protein